VPVPTDEATNLVVIQSHVFGVFKILFDMKAGANGPHHLLQGGFWWGEHEIVALLLRISDTAADEKPMASIIFPLVQHGNDGPVEEPGPFGSLTHPEAVPILFAQHPRFDQGSFFSSATSGGLEGDRRSRRLRQARRGTGEFRARCAGPGCRHRPYRPRPTR
jgi:hypothetical protein